MVYNDMLSDWKVLKLGELGRIVTGKTPSTQNPAYFSGDIPFVTPSDMNGRKVISETERYLTQAGTEAVRGAKIPKGSVMASCIGSDMGKVAIAGEDCVTNQQLNSIIVSDEHCSDFVYYNLSSRKEELQRLASSGSAQPILNKGYFSQLTIALPPLDEQKAITRILGALDDKVELNRQMNRTLEAMAQALFKSWFVDFDPVTAKAAGRKPYGMNEATAELFPDRFMESELGLIPEGWQVKQLGEFIDVIHGYAFQGEFFRTDPPGEILLTPGNFKVGGGFKDSKFKYYIGSVPDEYVLEEGDLIITMTDLSKEADTLGYPAIVPAPSNGRFLHNQRLGKVAIKSSAPISKAHLYFLLRTDDYRSEILAGATGTTVKHTSPSRIKLFKLPFPPNKLSLEYGRSTETLQKRLSANEEELRTLAALRDVLLPKLLSGEIRVRQAENLVAEAV